MMAKGKKTIEVNRVKELANTLLASKGLNPIEKRGLVALIEQVLFETGNYKGYSHIYWDQQGFKEWQAAGKPGFPEKEQYIVGNLGDYARIYR